jgi:uncharacterized protein (PEP-CTERM system associated)
MATTEVATATRYALGVSLLLACPIALAQAWRVESSVEAQFTASDNIGADTAAAARRDLVLELRPRMRIISRGAGLRIDGSIGLDGTTYAKNSQYNRLSPNVRLSVGANLVERWLYFDSMVDIAPTSADTFAARANADTIQQSNRELRYRLMLSPYVEREIAPDTKFLARSDNSWVRSNGDATLTGTQPDVRFQNSTIRLERQPVRLGFLAELTRQQQTDQTANVTTSTIDAARVGASYDLGAQFALGAIVGREHSVFLLNDDNDTIKGVSLRWSPTERTNLNARVEQRFFGKGGDITFNHRTPQFAINGVLSRQPVNAPVSFGVLPAGGNVAALLDSLLTTRYPNPLERADIVSNLINQRGLPTTLTVPLETFSQTAQLVQNASLTVALLGRRHSLSFNVFSRRSTELTRAGANSLGVNPNDNLQFGGAMQFSRRLTPTRALDVLVSGIATDGLGPLVGQYSRDWLARVSLSEAISPRATATLGISRENVRSSVVPSSQENRVFVGITQRL